MTLHPTDRFKPEFQRPFRVFRLNGQETRQLFIGSGIKHHTSALLKVTCKYSLLPEFHNTILIRMRQFTGHSFAFLAYTEAFVYGSVGNGLALRIGD